MRIDGVIRTVIASTIMGIVGFEAMPAVAAPAAYFPASFSKETVACGSMFRRERTPIVSALENKWFSSHLLAAKEQSLLQASRNSRASYDAIRFTWLRTFDPPVVVRIEGINSAGARLIAKQLSGAGGYDPGTISKHVERQLTPTEIRKMRHLIMRTRLTSLPAKDCAFGTDGAEWLIEVADRNGYHFVNRWSPERGEVRDFGIAVLTLTGWQFKKVY